MWLVTGLVFAFGLWVMFQDQATYVRSFGIRYTWAIAVLHACSSFVLLPLVMPFATGASLAADRKSRLAVLFLTRGMSRVQLVLARALAGAVCSAVTVGVSMTVFSIAAALEFPFGDPGQVDAVVPFATGIFRTSPPVFFLLVFLITTGSVAAISALVLAVGSAVSSPLTCELAPIVLVMALGVGIPSSSSWLNPLERADFLSTWTRGWNTPVSMLAYWGVAWAVFVFVAGAVYHRREE